MARDRIASTLPKRDQYAKTLERRLKTIGYKPKK
jgi:hypothetical protein